MENIFELKFSFEQYVKDNVILKFSNKQGGAYNVFSYHWQCVVWAAVVGFMHDERKLLKTVDIRSPKTVISVHFSYSLPMAMQIY